MEIRAERLVNEGLAGRQGGRVVFTRLLLDTLRNRELSAFGEQLAAETRFPFSHASSGDNVGGTYRQRMLRKIIELMRILARRSSVLRSSASGSVILATSAADLGFCESTAASELRIGEVADFWRPSWAGSQRSSVSTVSNRCTVQLAAEECGCPIMLRRTGEPGKFGHGLEKIGAIFATTTC